jgi:hypothetical protein
LKKKWISNSAAPGTATTAGTVWHTAGFARLPRGRSKASRGRWIIDLVVRKLAGKRGGGARQEEEERAA